MSKYDIISAAFLAPLVLAVLVLASAGASAATCTFVWAVPGPYDITGNFRGRTETVTARLTNDCRVTIGLPGVFTGGPVKRAGSCLVFSFKVEDVRQTFTARWCKDYGVVPWQGRDVRAQIVARHSRLSPNR